MEATITIKVNGTKLEFAADDTQNNIPYWGMDNKQQEEVILILQSMAETLRINRLQNNQKPN